MSEAWKMGWLMSGVIALTGCGGSDGPHGEDGTGGDGGEDDGTGGEDGDDGTGDGNDGTGEEDGTVIEPWVGYCTGIFKEDTPILDAFDEVVFTARSGDEFLLSAFDDTFAERAEILYLAQDGPATFGVEPSAEGEWPFTSNCNISEGLPYYSVYSDVTVFADEEMTTKLCDLAGGSVLPAGSSGRGFAFVGTEGSSAIYNVILGPFSEECGGDRGYILIPQTTSFGSRTWLVPIFSLIGPD